MRPSQSTLKCSVWFRNSFIQEWRINISTNSEEKQIKFMYVPQKNVFYALKVF